MKQSTTRSLPAKKASRCLSGCCSMLVNGLVVQKAGPDATIGPCNRLTICWAGRKLPIAPSEISAPGPRSLQETRFGEIQDQLVGLHSRLPPCKTSFQ